MNYQRLCCPLLLLALFLLAGCTGKSPSQVRYLWPIPPDGPRLEFIGSYKTANDLPHNFWSRWLESITGSTIQEVPLRKPKGVYANGEKIYVADEVNRNIMIFNIPDRTVSPIFQTVLLGSPLDIAGDKRGNIYIADAGMKRILVFSPELTLLHSFGDKEGLQRPAHITINDSLARLYVTDSTAHRIVVYDLAGSWLFTFGAEGDSRGEFKHPQGVAIDRSGRLFVADSGNARIQIFDQDGNFQEQFGQRGKTIHDFLKPVDLAFDSEGNLHIVDQGLIALLSYSPDGKILLATGSGAKSRAPMGLAKPVALHIDAKDRIYISDAINRRISAWQYLSTSYLDKFPIGHAQLHALQTYLSKTTANKINIKNDDIESAFAFVQHKVGEEITASTVRCRNCNQQSQTNQGPSVRFPF